MDISQIEKVSSCLSLTNSSFEDSSIGMRLWKKKIISAKMVLWRTNKEKFSTLIWKSVLSANNPLPAPLLVIKDNLDIQNFKRLS